MRRFLVPPKLAAVGVDLGDRKSGTTGRGPGGFIERMN
jgi:hypothetical protein